ncbi:MAG: PIN domain-containing protein [Coriobacteriia bacterium]|nr:PIN domain-containing protein [Coriobacteriia bacterium]
MPILTDTSVLVAAATPRETRHRDAIDALDRLASEQLAVPVTILTETLGFVRTRYGISYQRRLWDGLKESGIEVVGVDDALLDMAREIDERYADVGFGFADCTLLAACEVLRDARVLSFDRRLATYRPSFAPALEVLP